MIVLLKDKYSLVSRELIKQYLFFKGSTFYKMRLYENLNFLHH